MNTIIPQAWIIQERIRREEERKRKESEGNFVPISLPEQPDYEEEYFDPQKNPGDSTSPQKQNVIIIDI